MTAFSPTFSGIINQKYKKGEMEFLNKIKMEIIDENIQKEIISQVLHKK